MQSPSVTCVALELNRLRTSERIDDIEEFLAVSGSLDIAQGALSAIDNAGFGDLVIFHRVGRADVLMAHNAINADLAYLEIDTDFLGPVDDQIAVGQDLSDDHRHLQGDGRGAFREASIDPLLVIRWKDIFEALEDAIDACEAAANVIGNIVVKNA